MIRYRNYNRNAFLIYLTKFGKNPDAISTKSDIENSLTENEDYFCISYQIDIINWLQKCIESDELKEKTNIISILKQYLKMIKQITNQNSVEENIQLAEVLRANIDSIENVKKLNYALTSNEFYKPLIDKLIYISKSNNGIIEDENNLRKYKASKSGILIKFYKDKFKKFYFTFKFDCNEGYTNFSFSIRTKDSSSNTETKIGISNKYIKDHPNAIENKNEAYNFLFSEELEGYTDWENGNTIKNILDGKFEERYRMKIDELEKFIIEFEQGNEK